MCCVETFASVFACKLTRFDDVLLLHVRLATGPKPKTVWLVVIAAPRTKTKLDAADIPDRTLVMDREALARLYGPSLVSWMRLPVGAVDGPEAAASSSGIAATRAL